MMKEENKEITITAKAYVNKIMRKVICLNWNVKCIIKVQCFIFAIVCWW